MGELELKIALQQEGEERIRDIWHQSEDLVRKRRQEIQEELDRLREQLEGKMQREISSLKGDIMAQTRGQAMQHQLEAETHLAIRLFELAKQLLHELIIDSREVVWLSLCQELPVSKWATISIHPKDFPFAERDFPAARIERKENLVGGVIVQSADECICIDNSLFCRLAQAWPDILPKLMNSLREKVDNDATAYNNKSL